MRSFLLAAFTAACLVGACGSDSGSSSGATPDGGGADGGGSSGDGGGGGGPCTATGHVRDIVTQADGPIGGVAYDGTNVFVPGTFSGGAGVQRFAGTGGAGTPLASTPLTAATPDLATIVGTDIWFVGGLSGSVYKVAQAGGAATYDVVATGYDLAAMRGLYADADGVYLLGYKDGKPTVEKFPLAGGAPTTLAQLDVGQYALHASGGELYVSGGPIGSSTVKHIAKTPGTPETIINESCLVGLAVTASTVYCANNTSLLALPRAGGAGPALYHSSSSPDAIEEVVFTPDASVAYISDAGGDGNARNGRVLRVDIATGTVTTVACGIAPAHKLRIVGNEVAWTSVNVNINGKYDVQIAGP